MRMDPVHNQGLLRRLSRQIAASLKVDLQRRVETAGVNIKDLLNSAPPSQGIMEPYEGVVQGCGQPRVIACLTHYRAYHGRAGRAASPHTTTVGENTHMR